MSPKINVTIVCNGRFHHFDLARELQKRDMLERLFTSYPSWKLLGEDISPEHITTFPWLKTPYMALAKWNLLGHGFLERDLAWYTHESLDRYVTRSLPQSNLIFALSGSGLRCGKTIQARGGKYICDRGSSHIRFQDAIIKEEFFRWGIEFQGVDPRIVAKEEAEYESCDIITVPSTFAYHSFIEMGIPSEKIKRIPYGVDLRRFEKAGDPSVDRFDILFVGQVCFRKGVPYLLNAFKNFSHPNKHLTIIGMMSPEMEQYLKSTPSPENVEFLGPITQLHLKQFMSRSHVMILPSIEEGLAMVQAQALACGCPVIGTTNSGAGDLFSDGKEGYIVPIRDALAIVEKLQELADNPEKRQEMSLAALKRVVFLGGWNSYGDQMAEIFQELVNSD